VRPDGREHPRATRTTRAAVDGLPKAVGRASAKSRARSAGADGRPNARAGHLIPEAPKIYARGGERATSKPWARRGEMELRGGCGGASFHPHPTRASREGVPGFGPAPTHRPPGPRAPRNRNAANYLIFFNSLIIIFSLTSQCSSPIAGTRISRALWSLSHCLNRHNAGLPSSTFKTSPLSRCANCPYLTIKRALIRLQSGVRFIPLGMPNLPVIVRLRASAMRHLLSASAFSPSW
jgi:hypothetical protein